MEKKNQPEATIFIILGAGGDLTWRKLTPALYNLFLDQWLPDRFKVFGLDLDDLDDERFRDHLRKSVEKSSREDRFAGDSWQSFAAHLHFTKADLSDAQVYTALASRIEEQEKSWGVRTGRIFYLALPPDMVDLVTGHLAEAGLSADRGRARVVVEKPFGRDLASACELNRRLRERFEERQIFRIDHYLGKETVQNILAFRFGNGLFEPL